MTVKYDFRDLMDTIAPDTTEIYPREKCMMVLGITHTQFDTFLNRGVRSDDADRLACKVRLHPSLIWPSWFDDEEEETRCHWCQEMILGTTRLYCSPAHRKMAAREQERDCIRRRAWWLRMDHYRDLMTHPSRLPQVEEQAA